MNTRRVNGFQFEKMIRASLACLYAEEAGLNELNVFPVPDGDTGTNMRRTVEAGIAAAKPNEDAGIYIKSLSVGMLMGARGNSGVILSQFFKGMATALTHKPLIGIGEFRNALIYGYRTAYASVLKPVEGTILTVSREGIENIRRSLTRNTDLETLLSMYVAEMKKSLNRTPELLGTLNDAGVVDSGAAGLIVIFEGMRKCLYGEKLPAIPKTAKKAAIPEKKTTFNEYSAFEDGYCLEFILQLMKNEKFEQRFRLEQFKTDLELYGTSIVAVEEGSKVKVHIHTMRPSKVISLCEEYGVFTDFKLENMQIQHNERKKSASAAPKKPLCILAVVNGAGFAELYRSAGCEVIEGGATMNASTGEITAALGEINADNIVILPNSSNIIPAAEQAAAAFGKNITVIQTKSPVAGYFAAMMDVSDSTDTGYRINQIKKGASDVITLSEATASRNCTVHGISCRTGDEILLTDSGLSAVGSNAVECIISGLEAIEDINERESLVIFRGKDTDESLGDDLLEAVSEKFPLLECQIIFGGQDTYHWQIGVC